jgi:aerobic carbon-monoxide dehydrogenase small subunit
MRFRLNGKDVDVEAPPMKRLLDVLREECRLTGTKEGCGEGECGVCTVLLDDRPVCSCLVPFAQVRGAHVITIEGVPEDHPLKLAFLEEGAAQCGMCTPGMILTAMALPEEASREEIRAGLAGTLCRCTGYESIYRAVQRAQQPRAQQPGCGSGAKQPGANQPGAKQPGAKQPGANQPGANQPGANQPGAKRSGHGHGCDCRAPRHENPRPEEPRTEP